MTTSQRPDNSGEQSRIGGPAQSPSGAGHTLEPDALLDEKALLAGTLYSTLASYERMRVTMQKAEHDASIADMAIEECQAAMAALKEQLCACETENERLNEILDNHIVGSLLLIGRRRAKRAQGRHPRITALLGHGYRTARAARRWLRRLGGR